MLGSLMLTPDMVKGMAIAILVALYLYFGWIMPIMKIRDSDGNPKTGWIMLLVFLGIMPILLVVFQAARQEGPQGINGTTLNAGMGPQPVV